jgi:hypothetical protein
LESESSAFAFPVGATGDGRSVALRARNTRGKEKKRKKNYGENSPPSIRFWYMEGDYKICEVHYDVWRIFIPYLSDGPCCNMAFPQGRCFAIFGNGDNDKGDYNFVAIRSFVWFTYVFRNSPYRLTALPFLRAMNRRQRVDFYNQKIRLLARIGTLSQWRRRGYAKTLIEYGLSALDVDYVECLTAHNDVRFLLVTCGFKAVKAEGGGGISYFLWRRESFGGT